jgi:streptogramin lyase
VKPLGIAVDSHARKIWYVSTKQGTLGSYNLVSKKFDKEITIPIWMARQNPNYFSDVWSLRVDMNGDVWFTDQKQNAIWRYSGSVGGFEMYKVPEKSSAFGTTSFIRISNILI